MKIAVFIIIVFIANSCNLLGPEKSKNELEFDSLVSIIEPEESFLRSNMLKMEDSSARDSSEMLLDDLFDLSYPEIREKYELNDSTQEREFLDAISITVQIVTAKKQLEDFLRN